jgi:hypothetical protein
MRFKVVGNKYDAAFVVVHNPSTTVPIRSGGPCFFIMNGTNDGLDVQSANAAAGAGQVFFAGVVAGPDLAPGAYGEAQVYGICQNTRIVTITRPASTDSYNSVTAILTGNILQVNTLSGANASDNIDAFSRSGAGSASAILWNIVAAQSYTSTASQSSSFDTTSRTAITTSLKSFLRFM